MGFEFNKFSAKVASDPKQAAAELRGILLGAKLTARQVGERLGGASPRTVLRWVARLKDAVPGASFEIVEANGVEYPFTKRIAASPAKAAVELRKLIAEGLTAAQIGKRLDGATAKTVARWVALLNERLPASCAIELPRGPRVGSKRHSPSKTGVPGKRAVARKKK